MTDNLRRLSTTPPLNPTECITQQIPNRKPMEPAEERRQNERPQVDPLMTVIPQVGPPVGQAGEKPDLSFDLERQGNGRCVDDEEEKNAKETEAAGGRSGRRIIN